MAKTQESMTPSMEEILQTIRGVISGDGQEEGKQGDSDDDILELTDVVGDDGSVTTLTATANENTPVAAASGDVLANIDNALKKEAAPGAAPAPSQSQPATPQELPKQTAAPQQEEEEPTELRADEDMDALVADTETEADTLMADTEEEVDASEQEKKKPHGLISEATAKASTKALEHLMRKVPKPHVDGPSFRSGETLEALVIEAMKPDLSAWLDKNLPALVTQLVEKEIKKLLPRPEE